MASEIEAHTVNAGTEANVKPAIHADDGEENSRSFYSGNEHAVLINYMGIDWPVDRRFEALNVWPPVFYPDEKAVRNAYEHTDLSSF